MLALFTISMFLKEKINKEYYIELPCQVEGCSKKKTVVAIGQTVTDSFMINLLHIFLYLM